MRIEERRIREETEEQRKVKTMRKKIGKQRRKERREKRSKEREEERRERRNRIEEEQSMSWEDWHLPLLSTGQEALQF